jgi:hypothetical protein
MDAAGGVRYGRRVRLAFRVANVLVAVVTLASALAVLVSDLTVSGYREHYRDALWFVASYTAVQVVMLVELGRDGRFARRLVLAKTLAAYLFLAGFLVLWPYWKVWTPARYVYQVFESASGSQLGLMALVFLGRGAFNTVNAFVYTADWWAPLRVRRPLLGRLVTAVPIGITVLCVWIFLQLAREEARTFSPEAREVAQLVLADLDCDTIRRKAGQTTTDLRRRGERTYQVEIHWDCRLVDVRVRAEDGRSAQAAEPRPECCDGAQPPAGRSG